MVVVRVFSIWHFLKGRKKKVEKVNGSSVATHWLLSACALYCWYGCILLGLMVRACMSLVHSTTTYSYYYASPLHALLSTTRILVDHLYCLVFSSMVPTRIASLASAPLLLMLICTMLCLCMMHYALFCCTKSRVVMGA